MVATENSRIYVYNGKITLTVHTICTRNYTLYKTGYLATVF